MVNMAHAMTDMSDLNMLFLLGFFVLLVASYRSGYGFFFRPPTISNPYANNMNAPAKSFGPLSLRKRFPFISYTFIAASVIGLYGFICPISIARAITFIVIVPFKSMFWRWPKSNVIKERQENKPPIANTYASIPIIFICWVTCRHASRYHAAPYCMLSGFRQAVFNTKMTFRISDSILRSYNLFRHWLTSYKSVFRRQPVSAGCTSILLNNSPSCQGDIIGGASLVT